MKEDFFPIHIDDFAGRESTGFDIYLKLGVNHFTHVVHHNDPQARELIAGYLAKGPCEFFVPIADQERYLAFRKGQGQALEARIDQTLKTADETLRYLKQFGLQDAQLENAKRFSGQIHELLHKDEIRKHEVFKAFVANLGAVEHGTGTAILAHMIAESAELTYLPSTLGAACLFHDIGLIELGPGWDEVDLIGRKMSAEDRKLFETHPARGAEILRRVGGFEPEAIQAVELHHQRLTRTGFPKLVGGRKPYPLAEVLGLADEFHNLVMLAKRNPGIQPLKEMEAHVFDGFSMPMVNAFRNFFFLASL